MNLKKAATIEFWMIPLFILLMASASILFQNNLQIFALVGLLGGILYLKQYKIDMSLIDIALIWIIINLFSIVIINSGQDFSLVTVFSRFMPIVLAYFIVKLSGKDFYDKLNKHVFILTIISLPLFAIQSFAPGILMGLYGVFGNITREEFANAGSWYSYFYMFNLWHIDRNCGFMWEPGAFAGFLVFLITYRLSKNDFKIDKYIVLYLIALITTFSTAGYLALSVLLFAYYLKNRKQFLLLIFLFPLLIYFGISFYQESDFLSGKIETYLELGSEAWGVQTDGTLRTSRLGYAMIVLDESIHWPFGHGIIDSSNFKLQKYGDIFGPGALASILHQWGWIGIIATLWCIYRFYNQNLDKSMSWLFTGAMGIILFSNPFNFLMLIYSILFYVLLYVRKKRKKESFLPSGPSEHTTF